jgi:ubiquinone/menaquinone biosynthesis C-methylase UbiE
MDYPRSIGAHREGFEANHAGPAYAKTDDIGTSPSIPDYLQSVYRWAYLDDRNARFLDNEYVVKTILWWQHRRLQQAAFSEIVPGQRVLQAACVYGTFSVNLARHIGDEGRLDIIDVAEVQVRNCRRKLAGIKHARVHQDNIINVRDETFDAACCYFLLHELPNDYKTGAIRALLKSVEPGGKVVFVDYHKPHWAHPLKPLTSLIFDTLEPYAKDLWRNEIATYVNCDKNFTWQKETLFGGLYQKVVATRTN